MKHMNIYNSAIYEITGVANQLDTIVKFLISNRNVRIPTPDMAEIAKTKVLATTPISTIYDNAVQSKRIDNLFAALQMPRGSNVPEALTMNHITIDTLQLKEYDQKVHKALSALPEFRDKIVVNLTHLLKKTVKNAVSDMNELQSLFVRGLLVRSYFTSTNWLTPQLIKFLSKSYSMTVSSNIARNYDLTIQDQMVVATILTAYFHQLCYADTKEGEWPVTVNDCDYLGRRFDIMQILDDMKEKLGGKTEMDIETVCELISKSGPSRLESFNKRAFYTSCQQLGNDNITTLLALEYPPYWAHQVLLALSGIKSGLYFSMKKIPKMLPEGKVFTDTLNRSPNFLPAIPTI